MVHPMVLPLLFTHLAVLWEPAVAAMGLIVLEPVVCPEPVTRDAVQFSYTPQSDPRPNQPTC